ncbi:MAG: hypothetical protein NT013_27830 [Planctomycetia bacterium]|nr:hypothetical protein [Planctomycetia bacterium]
MSGIGGIGGMGMSGVDLSAWAGMGGVSNVFGTTLAPMVTQPQAAQVSSVGMGTNLQALVQTLQQFSQAEILLALFLAFNTRRCDQHHDHHSALDGLAAFALASAFNQQSSVPGNVDVASMVTSVSSQTAMSINVTG